MTDYTILNEDLKAMVTDVPCVISNLANASALLYQTLSDINWAGFYLMEGGRLVLGPFQGKPACTSIEVGKGVCGTAVLRRESVLVEDVHTFSGHIACDSASNSEIVLPLIKNGEVFGVLDIDSPSFSRFTEKDREGLSDFVKILEGIL